MSLAIALVVVAAVFLVVIFRVAVSRNLRIAADASLAKQINPIDVEAFRNLTDPAEDEFLRRRLSAAEFRRVRRERLRAMLAYIQTAGRNAAVLIQIGQAALASGHEPTAEAARHLVNQALLLRRNAAFALLKVYAALVWPTAGLTAAPILRAYEQLNGSVMLLSRLQNPAAPVRISAA
ncbi:MAG TPA: hypothetical protein VMD99_13470 [Terriglobales bacterium]|nr:hypothetical protein [Terriglobales bacterium]